MPPIQYGTADGHNPEIIYHLLERQAEFPYERTFNELDQFLRARGLSAQTQRLEAQVMAEIGDTGDEESESFTPELPPTPRMTWDETEDGPRENHAENGPQNGHISTNPSGSQEGQVPNHGPYRNRMETISEEPEADDYRDHESVIDTLDIRENYGELMDRLSTRTARGLEFDTNELLNGDYMHGAHRLDDPHDIIRFMTAPNNQPHIFQPEFDFEREQYRREDRLPLMPSGPFVYQYEDPTRFDHFTEEQVLLPHIYLPGWQGNSSEDALYSKEWLRGAGLACGRYNQEVMVFDGTVLPGLMEVVRTLGFPSIGTFTNFVQRPEIKAAFRELWDTILKHTDSDIELPVCQYTRRPVSLRIFYARTLAGDSEFDDDDPDKSDWNINSHVARFCLKVERVCNRWLLPPMRGQIPVLAGKAPVEVVAWGGIELARILRRMQKGYSCRIRYLDDSLLEE